MTIERERRARRAKRLARSSDLRSSVRLTRVGLRKDFGLPIAHLCAFYAHKLSPSMKRWLQRNFNVVNAKRAKIKAAIQKRAIIFDSFQPCNSKWW
jgi:hypothetical protein